MPVYRYKGDIYDIPDEKVSAFEKQFPDATVSFQSDGDVFDIPVSKKAQFLKQYPKAQLYSEQQESVTQPSRPTPGTEQVEQVEQPARTVDPQAAAEGRSLFNQMTAARRGTSSLSDAPQATQDYLNRPLSKEDKDKYTGKAGPSMDEMYLGAEQIKQQALNAAEKYQEAVENPKLARFNELIDKAQSTKLMSADEYKEMNDLYSAPEVNPMAQLKAAIARRNFNNSPEGEFARLSQQLTKLDKNSKEYEAVEKAWKESEFHKTKSEGLKKSVAELAEKTRESLGMDSSLYTTWFKTMMRNPATNPSGVLPDTHVKDTQAATSRMLAEAAKILNDPSKYDDTTWLQRRGRFAKEYGKEMVNSEMWLKSLFQAEDLVPLRNVFGKIAEHYGNVDERLLKDDDIDNILDEDEKNLLRAYFMLSEAQTLRPEVADYIQSARSAANSTKFIIEMAISGEALGFNALEKKLYDEGAKKLAATYLAKWAEKQIVWDGTFALAAKAGQAVTKLAGKSLLTYATSYPAVLFHPTTWGDFAERISRPNEDGKYDPDALKEAWGAIRDQQKERWTETLGETVFNEFLGSAVRGLGLAGRKALGNGLAGKMADEAAYRFSDIGDYISSTKPAQFIKKAANSSWGQKVRQIAEATHFDGIGPEIGEEGLGAAIDAFRQKSAEPLRDFFTWDNLIMTGESFLPMYIWGGGFSAAGLAASRIKYGHSSKRLENLMKKYGYSDEQVQYIFDQTKGAAPAEISRLLADMGSNITNSRFGAAAAVVMDDEQVEIVNAFKDYLRDSVEYNTYDAMREEEEAGQREVLKRELEDNYGHKFYIDADDNNPQRVVRARVNDGKGGLADVFILDDKPGSNGRYYAMYPDGQMGWISVSDMAPMTDEAGNPVLDNLGRFIPSFQAQTLDAFLSEQVMARRQAETAVDNTNRLLAANATLMESVKQIEDNLKHNGKDGYLVRSDESGAEFRPFDDDGKPGEFVPWAQLAIENGITTADAPIPTAEDEVEAEGESMAQAVISRRNIAELVNIEGENSYTIEQDGKTYRLIYAIPGSVDAVEGRITGVFAGPNGERRAFSFAYDDVLNPRFEGEGEGEGDGVEPPAAPKTEPEPTPAPAAEETPAEEAPQSKIPVDKDGNKIYDAPGVEPIDAYDDMYSTPGLTEEDVDEWVIAQSDEAEKNRNPKNKKGQSLQDWGKEKAEANRKADFWKQFREIAEERAKEREEARRQEAERQKEIEKYGVDTRNFDLTPQTVEEAVADYLGNNEGIIDLDDAKKEVFGKSGRIPSELFRHVGNGGILTKKGGRTIADIANDIVGEYEGQLPIEQDAVRDLIIGYLARYTKSEMREMIFNNRLNAALAELEQQNGASSEVETAEEVVDDMPPAEEEDIPAENAVEEAPEGTEVPEAEVPESVPAEPEAPTAEEERDREEDISEESIKKLWDDKDNYPYSSDVTDLFDALYEALQTIDNPNVSKEYAKNKRTYLIETALNHEGHPLADAILASVTTPQPAVEQQIKQARQEVDTNPTDAQKEAGNYKKGHIQIDGYDVTIENPKGSVRSGKDANGNEWSVTMNNDYGYIRGTEGVDGDHIDMFLSDHPGEGKVFVVDQVNEDGTFDEHKVMYGFNSEQEAMEAYLANYSPGWKGLGNITEVSKEEFKKWIDSSHRKTKPFAEYSSVKTSETPGNSVPSQEEERRNRLDELQKRVSIVQQHPANLRAAYESGDAERIASAEKAMSDFINSSDSILLLRGTENVAKDRRKKADKGSAEYKLQDFILKAIKKRIGQLDKAAVKAFDDARAVYEDRFTAEKEALESAIAYFQGELETAQELLDNVPEGANELYVANLKNRVSSAKRYLDALTQELKRFNEEEEEEEKEPKVKNEPETEVKEPEKPAEKPAQKAAKASTDEKIEDFGEKIGGARKDTYRAKIRDAVKLTAKDLKTLKDPDKILPRKKIISLMADGSMPKEDGLTLLSLNMAVRSLSDSLGMKTLGLMKYRDLAAAWENGEALKMEITDADIDFMMDQKSDRVKAIPNIREKERNSLDVLFQRVYNDYRSTYEALNYPAENRALKSAYIRYGSADGRYWVVGSPSSYRGWPFPTMEQAVAKMKAEYPEIKETENNSGETNKGSVDKIGNLLVTKDDLGYYRIKSRSIPGKIYLSKKFYSKKDAEQFLKDNAASLVDREQKMVDALLGSNIGMVQREGIDYRNGKDVTPDQMLETFGFRGVEFGNWVPQAERQEYLNKTYDAIMDFCDIVGISPKAFSLGGRLGLAFGARGHSRALAHYEPMKEVINLTRMKGAGSLAHEWFHALDNYLAKQKTGNTSDMATDTKNVVREEMAQAFRDFVGAMNQLDYSKRSRRAGDYWGEVWERAARLFESYVYNELANKSVVSPLLVRKDTLFDDVQSEDNSASSWPYPSIAENEQMKPFFDKLFGTIEEKVGEDGKVLLFREGDSRNASFTTAEIKSMETPILQSKGTFNTLAEAEAWAKENLQGQSRTNKFTGDEISIGRKSVKEMLGEKATKGSVSIQKHLAALQSVLDFIETGIPGEIHEDTHGRGFDVMRLFNAIEIDGKLYRVKSTVRKVRNGDRYYTYEVQEMELMEERRANRESEEQGSVATNNSNNSITGAKLLKGVKKTNSSENILDESDIVAQRVSAAELEATNATLDRMSEEMGIKINRVGRSEMPRGHKSDKGYYNTSTGEMTICMDNVTDERDAIATVLHETVGHHGLRQLFGDRFNDAMARIYAALDQKGKTWVNGYIARHPNADNTRAVEEYLSHLAESGDFKNTVWDNIKRIIGQIVDALFGTNGFLLTDNELNYILRASYENLKNPNWLNTVEGRTFDTVLKRQLGINESDPNKPTDPQGPDAGNLYRDGDTKTAAEGFDSDMKKGRFVRKMEFQDHVVPVRKAYEHVQKETGKKEIAEDEDYAMRQNQVSSRSYAELQIFRHRQYDPAMETVAEIIGKLLGIPKRKVGGIAMWLKGLVSGKPKNAEQRNAYKRVSNYLYAVSGLERNASKNAEIEQAKQAKLADAAADGITDPAKLAEIEKKYEDMKRDWSGLTGLFNLPADQWQEAEKKAQEMIDEFKLAVNDDAMLDELWDRLRACTDYNLEHAYKYGLLTREEFERLHGTDSKPRMWEYYLPLRGFEEKTAEEEYSYANLANTQADPVVKKMKGRVTQSADPIANILKIAQAEIVQGNNNWAKQALWRFVLNAGKNSLLTQAEPWYQKDPATGTWTLAQPADGESLEHFEEKMKKNKELEPDNYKKGRNGLRLNLIMANKANRNAHAIHVKVGGIEKIIWVNGDAVLAKAVNGNFGWNNKFVQMWRSVNRYLSQAATSWSLKFTDKNVWRDTQFSRIATMVDEGQAYLHQLEKNWWANSKYGAQMVPIVRFMTAPVIKLVRDWENGTLIKKGSSELTERERMFVDFMTDGGATGYTVVQSMDDIKREVDRMIRNAGKGVGAFPLLGAYIKYASTLSEASELLTRFSVYQTSRQMGRSRQRSAYDAKETSVNFNRRGMQSGEGVWGWISAAMGLCYLFINPAIQSLDKFARLHKSHPWRMGAVDAAFIMMGFTNSLLNSMLAGMADGGGDGDDDDDKMGPDWYWNIPEWVRRSNMIIGSPFKKLGKWGYLVIPIALEYKGFYALGEMLSSIVQGKYADRDVATIANDVVGLVGEMLPLNPIEGYSTGDNIPQTIGRAVAPDIAAPWVNIATNRNFAGIPLRRKNIYDQTEPRAYGFYASTPKVLTDMCIKVSEKTATWPVHIDVSSGELRELLKGYGSGIYNYLEGFGKVAFADDEHPRRWSDFPYLSGLTGYLEEDRRDSFSDNVIRKYKQNSDDVVTRIRAAAPNGLWDMDKVERGLSAKEREKLPKDPEIIIYKYGDYLSKEANAAKILLGEDYILGREYYNETQEQTSGKQAKLAKNGSTRIVDKVTRPALKDLRKDWMDARKKYLEMPEGKTEEEQAAKDKAKESVQKAYLEYCKAEQDIANKLLEEEYHNAQTKLKNGIPYERKKTLGERAYELTNSK